MGPRLHAPGPSGANLASCSFHCRMTTLPPGSNPPEAQLEPESGPGPGSPAVTRPGLYSPPEAPYLRVFALVAIELSGFPPGQEAPAGPRGSGWRLSGCRWRRWWRLRLFVVHDQRAGTAGCRLHLGCSTPPAQFTDCSRDATLA